MVVSGADTDELGSVDAWASLLPLPLGDGCLAVGVG